jgi:RNA polymerase sigma-70 factor, ECF subfamily
MRPGEVRSQDFERLSDRALLALVRRGDRAALGELYDAYGGAAYSLALRIVGDRELAGDVVQQAFLTVCGQGVQPGAPQSPSLVLSATREIAVMARRGEARRGSGRRVVLCDERAGGTEFAERVGHGRGYQRIGAALSALPDFQRELIELLYFGGYTQSELAGRLSMPLAVIKTRTLDAMKALADELAAAPDTRRRSAGRARG